MRPSEVYWLIEARRPVKMYGLLTEQEAEQLYFETYGED